MCKVKNEKLPNSTATIENKKEKKINLKRDRENRKTTNSPPNIWKMKELKEETVKSNDAAIYLRRI